MARARIVLSFVIAALHVMACGPPPHGGDDDGDGSGTIDAGTVPTADAAPFVGEPVVYAHSATTLYKINPDTFAVTMIGDFVWPQTVILDQMTDIAIDKSGEITGVSYGRVYAVDRETVVCTHLADLNREFNGLSWVPGGTIESEEVLVGTTLDGSVWQIDPMTGVSTQLGAYGGGWTSSGDLVSVDGFGTVATVTMSAFGGNDTLARIDFPGGAATPIATGVTDTGFADIWGVGFWKGKVFGFTDYNLFVLIDVTTGAATLQESGSVQWWGAGVTTEAPIIP